MRYKAPELKRVTQSDIALNFFAGALGIGASWLLSTKSVSQVDILLWAVFAFSAIVLVRAALQLIFVLIKSSDR